MTSLFHILYDMPGPAPRMDFFLRGTRLSNKLLEQGYVKERLKSLLNKFCGRYGDLIKQCEVPLSRMLNDILTKYNDNLPPIDFIPIRDLFNELDLVLAYERFP